MYMLKTKGPNSVKHLSEFLLMAHAVQVAAYSQASWLSLVKALRVLPTWSCSWVGPRLYFLAWKRNRAGGRHVSRGPSVQTWLCRVLSCSTGRRDSRHERSHEPSSPSAFAVNQPPAGPAQVCVNVSVSQHHSELVSVWELPDVTGGCFTFCQQPHPLTHRMCCFCQPEASALEARPLASPPSLHAKRHP